MPKGITPVISVILLLLITIAIVGFAMIFMQRSAASAAEESEEQLSKQTASLGENFEIININGNQVTVRNKGTAELKNLAFYVDGNKMTASGSSISKDGIGTFSLDAAQLAQYPGKKLKVSSAGMSKEETADFYKKNTVAYYTFDGTDGRTIKDESGNGNDGTFVGETWNDGTLSPACPNCPQQTTGKYGNGMSFDGVDDVVTIPAASSPSVSGAFTLMAWVKEAGRKTAGGVLGRYDHDPLYYLVRVESGQPVCEVTSGGTLNSGITIPLGEWQHIVCTFDETTAPSMKIYVNGVMVASGNRPAPTVYSSYSFRIGQAHPTQRFNGAIDEVRIYNKALSPQEITEDMNSAYPIYRPVASWSFDSVSANQVKDTHNVVKGQYGSALSFDGVDDYVNIPDSASLKISGTETLTVEAWAKANEAQASNTAIFSRGLSGGHGADRYYSLLFFSASFRGLVSSDAHSHNENNIAGSGSYTDNQWHHGAFAVDSTQLRVYADGVGIATPVARTVSIGYSNAVNNIGRDTSYFSYFKGAIDEVRILNTAIG